MKDKRPFLVRHKALTFSTMGALLLGFIMTPGWQSGIFLLALGALMLAVLITADLARTRNEKPDTWPEPPLTAEQKACPHTDTLEVTVGEGAGQETVAQLCTDCQAQLPSDFVSEEEKRRTAKEEQEQLAQLAKHCVHCDETTYDITEDGRTVVRFSHTTPCPRHQA